MDAMRKFHQYCVIAGNALKHCDLDSVIDFFQERFPTWKGTSVAKLVVDMTLTFATGEWPLEMRKSALYAVGNTCQSWPKNYSATNVSKTLRAVFDEQNPDLERIILLSLKEFLSTEEKRSEEAAAESIARNNTATSKNRELTVMGGASDGDSAIAASRDYLNEITRISLATQDDHALLALEVLGSINRQGIVHPKELGVTFITLETSSNHRISELAYQEHRRLHEKHETLVEREYVRALHAAFSYQRDIVRDPRGATTDPFTAKLHLMMEALKISRSKNRQKFLEKLCGQVDFDLAKLDVSEEMPGHLLYSQFLIENMAFLEYITIGEVVGLVAAAEKLFSNTGAPVAHAIESEVFQMRMDIDATLQATGDGQPGPSTPDVGFMRLKQLTSAVMVLLSLWEVRTYLRRLYGMGTTRRDPKAKAQSKDLSKTPVKVQGVNGDKFWDDMGHIMTALSSRERMMETCRSFVDLMNVDREFKIADEDDDLNGEEPTTPTNDDDDEGGSINTPARSRKRKAGGTPGGRKKRARSSSQPRKRGRPRKQTTVTVDVDADGEFDDGDWF
jgi:cohesin loading factor subunit SCC2